MPLPLPLLRQLADAALKERLPSLQLPCLGVVNTLSFWARPLGGCYWTPVLGSGTEFNGVIEMSTLTGTARYGGRHLAYVMKYTDRNSALFPEKDAIRASPTAGRSSSCASAPTCRCLAGWLPSRRGRW